MNLKRQFILTHDFKGPLATLLSGKLGAPWQKGVRTKELVASHEPGPITPPTGYAAFPYKMYELTFFTFFLSGSFIEQKCLSLMQSYFPFHHHVLGFCLRSYHQIGWCQEALQFHVTCLSLCSTLSGRLYGVGHGSTFILANADNWFSQVGIQNKMFTTKGMRHSLSKPRMSGYGPGTWFRLL